jgi:hypothetical protein
VKVAGLLLGIIGGIIGLVASGFALGVGAIGSATGAQGSETVIGLGWAALGLSVVGIVGGALSLAKPRVAALLMLIAGIGGSIAISIAYVVAGPLLIIGAVLAFLGRAKKAPAASLTKVLTTGSGQASSAGEPVEP